MNLTTYRIENNSFASGGQDISLVAGASGERGQAEFNFTGLSGNYDVIVGYFDENDGIARIEIEQNNLFLDGWDLNAQLGSNVGNQQTFVQRTVAQNLTINTGDDFSLKGFEQASEHARIDYVELIPRTGNNTVINQPSVINLNEVSGELQKWHEVTLNFIGPKLSENSNVNIFRDYRLDVTFTHVNTAQEIIVPGYYAADGNAAETGAAAGQIWQAKFSPPLEGNWTYQASFRQGKDISAQLNRNSGNSAGFFDGKTGSFNITPTNKTGQDLRGKGLLEYVGKHYLQFAETGEYFIKGGADSPENFLAYQEFDGTYDVAGNFLHQYQPHLQDWNPSDPTWQGGKGKGIIGAINYLASTLSKQK